jgi:hypothetical protein
MAELKTKPTTASVAAFLKNIENPDQRDDCRELARLLRQITGKRPKMWGPSIVGYGSYHYRNRSGREGDWFLAGFSPRKQNLTIYVMPGFDRYPTLMKKLGKYKTGKCCLYVKRLSDVDRAVLRQLLVKSVNDMETGNLCG